MTAHPIDIPAIPPAHERLLADEFLREWCRGAVEPGASFPDSEVRGVAAAMAHAVKVSGYCIVPRSILDRLAAAEAVVEAVTRHELCNISLRSPVFDALNVYDRAQQQGGEA